jgi:hypothetical protein
MEDKIKNFGWNVGEKLVTEDYHTSKTDTDAYFERITKEEYLNKINSIKEKKQSRECCAKCGKKMLILKEYTMAGFLGGTMSNIYICADEECRVIYNYNSTFD